MELKEFVEDHYKRFYRFVFTLSRNTKTAEELTRKTFSNLAKIASQVEELRQKQIGLFSGRRQKQQAFKRNRTYFSNVKLSPSKREIADLSLEQIETIGARQIIETLQAMQPIHRTPLTLFYVENLSYKEIAKILNVSPPIVISRLAQGKLILKQDLRLLNLDN